MALEIRKAKKYAHKLRLGLGGPTGSGKTYTMLRIACEIAKREGGRVGVIDSEHGTASLYAEEFDFDVIELESFAPDRYVEAIHAFEKSDEHVVIGVDSLSHAWIGKDGELEQVDHIASQNRDNSFIAWRKVTPQHNDLVEALVACKKHLIVTMRSKMAYEMQEDPKSGKKTPIKLGLQPVMRDGIEYEFDLYAEIGIDHTLEISKTRCKAVDGYRIKQAGEELAGILYEWSLGDAAPERPARAEGPTVAARGPAVPEGREQPAPPRPNDTRAGGIKPVDQFGEFRGKDGNPNWEAYQAHLRDQTTTPDAWAAVAPGKEGKGWSPGRWLLANPTLTLTDLTWAIVEKQREMEQARAQAACDEHVATVNLAGDVVCEKCGVAMDTGEPDPEEAQQAALV